jgi:hypothetical protein
MAKTSARPDIDTLEAQIASLTAQLQALGAEVIGADGPIASAADAAAETIGKAGHAAQSEIDMVVGFVRQRPLTAMLAAGAIGYVFARLTR